MTVGHANAGMCRVFMLLQIACTDPVLTLICFRIVKRDIGHLCHDERKSTSGKPGEGNGVVSAESKPNASKTQPAIQGETPRTLQRK